MNLNLNKKAILKKTATISILTLLSRCIAIAREMLQIRFFGVGALSDAFIMAFRLPNLFRHVFAEGALSASFVPEIVKIVKGGNREQANGLMSISLQVLQSILLLFYIFVLYKTELVVKIIAPGFSVEQINYAITFIRILFPFILLVSGSALFAGALNAVNHFFVPAFGPTLLNGIYVATLVVCLKYHFDPTILCYGVLVAGFAQLIMHIIAYFRYGFTLGPVTQEALIAFKNVMRKFLPCLLGVSIVEINLFVGGMLASFLPKGSVSLLYYGSRFMNVPLGVFAVAFASVLLSHFSRVVTYAPRRMSFYLIEVTKFVSWFIIPVAALLAFMAERVFITFLAKSPSHLDQVHQAKWILIIYAAGLMFFCINKILLSIFYSLKDTSSTTLASAIGVTVNLIGDLVGMHFWGVYGIAGAACLASFTMTVTCLIMLAKRHNVHFNVEHYTRFLARYALHLLLVGIVFWYIHEAFLTTLWPLNGIPASFVQVLSYWLSFFGLAGACMLALFQLHRMNKLKLYFLRRHKVIN